jgi:hypothetical protein
VDSTLFPGTEAGSIGGRAEPASNDAPPRLQRPADDEPAAAARRRVAAERAAREQQARLEQALELVSQWQALRQSTRTKQKDRDKPVRVPSTAPEVRKMLMPEGGVRPAYNPGAPGQFATDVASGAVVGVDATQAFWVTPVAGAWITEGQVHRGVDGVGVQRDPLRAGVAERIRRARRE